MTPSALRFEKAGLRMDGRIKYLVFGFGMLVLAIGVSLSVWITMTRIASDEVPATQVEAPALTVALAQAMGLSDEGAEQLAERLQAAALLGRINDLAEESGGEISLAQVLRQVLLLTTDEADDLVTRLQAAVQQAQNNAPDGGGGSLTDTLQQTLGLSEQAAEELADRLIAASEAARTGEVSDAPAPAPGGPGAATDIGESIEFEVRDSSGNLKQSGSTP